MRGIFWKALFGLFLFDVLLLGRSHGFARLHHIVRGWAVAPRPSPHGTVEAVCGGINHALIWYPKRVLCLQRSAVATCLLRSEGVPAVMVLGAQKFPFMAHAWVEVDGHPINEKHDVQAKYGIWERC
jgi:hypothetical protein